MSGPTRGGFACNDSLITSNAKTRMVGNDKFPPNHLGDAAVEHIAPE